MSERQRFQGKCLQGTEGRFWMKMYDDLPVEVRHRLSVSPFNLCVMCVHDFSAAFVCGTDDDNYHHAIKHMEDLIRQEPI